MADVEVKTTYRELFVPLTRAEKAEKGQDLAAKMERRRALDETRKEIANQMKILDKETSEIALVLDQGQERRPVECRAEFDYGNNEVRVFRAGDGELIDTRAMSADERQPELGMD